jgi:hypothetical protein
MNNINEYQKVLTDNKWSLSSITSLPVKNKIVLGVTAMAMLALGSLFLAYYPLETMIVSLFIGSVFVLDRR